jgi:hypothetical protein
MNKSIIILTFCLISILSCATIKNSSGYIITNKTYNNSDGKKNKYYKQTYCNDQKAVAWYEIDGFKHLGYIFFYLENGKYGRYVVEIKNKFYAIDVNKIMPLEVGQAEVLKIAQIAGFNSYSEYQKNFEEQRLLAQEEKKRQNEEKRLELIRLRKEIDNKFGVIVVGSLLHIKNGEVKIGEIIRLGDTFSNMNSWSKSKNGGYIFEDYNEFEIRGLDMKQVKVNEIGQDLSGHFMQGGRITAGGRRGYIVKYLGTEDVITQAGLRKVIWVCECIGGNIYAE